MSNVALYQLANQYLELAEKLSGYDLDAQTIQDTIEGSGITDELSVKAQGIEFVARESEKYNPLIDMEIARLQALKASRERVAAGLRKYLLDNMQRTGITKISCPLFAISIQNNPPSVEVFDPLSLPKEFMRQPDTPPPSPDKTAIKTALKVGIDIPGAKLVQSQRLVIK